MASTQVKCIYANSAVIPCPTVELKRNYDRSADGTVRRKFWTITLSGVVIANMGSPDSTGAFYGGVGYPPDEAILAPEALFYSLQTKLKALAQLFSIANEGKWLEFYSQTGVPLRCQPRWSELVYPQGKWYNKVDFSITGEADFITPFDTAATQDETPVEEQWSLDRIDEEGRSFRLTHSVSASGKNRYDGVGVLEYESWEVARDLVIGGPSAGAGAVSKLGYDANQGFAASVLDLSGVSPYNYIRGQQTDKAGGRFTATESWVLFNPADLPTGLTGGVCIEEFSVDTNYSNDTGLSQVQLQGTIRGLEERDPTTYAFVRSKYDNAALRAAGITPSWAKTLAQTVSGVTLNPNPSTTTIARNKISGVITYSANFDNRIGLYDSANVSEVVTIEFDNACGIVAQIPVPFRAAGPILQDVGTVGTQSITVNVEIVRPILYGQTPTIPTFNTLAKALEYISGTPSQIFMVNDRPRWVEQQGRFSRSSQFIYQY